MTKDRARNSVSVDYRVLKRGHCRLVTTGSLLQFQGYLDTLHSLMSLINVIANAIFCYIVSTFHFSYVVGPLLFGSS